MKRIIFLLTLVFSLSSFATDLPKFNINFDFSARMQMEMFARTIVDVTEAPFSAANNGTGNQRTKIQYAIDSMVGKKGTVFFPAGTYQIDSGLVVYSYSGGEYQQASVMLLGEDRMHSPGITTIRTTDSLNFCLALQKNKGTAIQGITFKGVFDFASSGVTDDSLYRSARDVTDGSCRSTRYSPYSGIVIDPFYNSTPPDGGYPSWSTYYRGDASVGGSTGIFVDQCTFDDFTIGITVSPSGHILNGEMCTFSNIRIMGDCRNGFASGQAQEKLNRIINWEAWGRVRTLFLWNTVGDGEPGFYTIDGVNIAGNVVEGIYRASAGFFPLFVSNFYAESIGSFADWSSAVGDAVSNSSINFLVYSSANTFPRFNVAGEGVAFYNVDMRYYGNGLVPLGVFSRYNLFVNTYPRSTSYAHWVMGWYYSSADSNYQNGFTLTQRSRVAASTYYVGDDKIRTMQINEGDAVNVGDYVFITALGNSGYVGMAIVSAVNSGVSYTIDYISPSVEDGTTYDFKTYSSSSYTSPPIAGITGWQGPWYAYVGTGSGDTVIQTRIRNLRRTTPPND